MDTQKLLKVLTDFVREDEEHSISSQLSNLTSLVSQNNASTYAQAQEVVAKLDEVFDSSRLNDYTVSYQAILRSIEAERFSGSAARLELDSILASSPLEFTAKLTKFTQRYEAVIANCRGAISSLEDLGIEPYSSPDFEVGFILPSEMDNMQEVTNSLVYLERFLVICSQIAGNNDPKVKLKRASTGSLEFFVAQGIICAKIVETVLKHIAGLVAEFQKIQQAKANIELINANADNLKADTIKKLAEVEKTLRDQVIEQAAEEVMNKYAQADQSSRAELRNQLAVAIKVLLKDIQHGVEVEVAPPTERSEAQETSGEEHEDHVQELANLNRDLKRLYDAPQILKRLPLETRLTEKELETLRTDVQVKHPASRSTRTKQSGDNPAKK